VADTISRNWSERKSSWRRAVKLPKELSNLIKKFIQSESHRGRPNVGQPPTSRGNINVFHGLRASDCSCRRPEVLNPYLKI